MRAVVTKVSLTTSIPVVTASITIAVAQVATAIPIPVAITITEPSECFVASVTLAIQFPLLPRAALLPFCQFFFYCWNALMHELEKLTFQSTTLFVCAERTWTPRCIFQVFLNALDLPFEIRHLSIKSVVFRSA